MNESRAQKPRDCAPIPTLIPTDPSSHSLVALRPREVHVAPVATLCFGHHIGLREAKHARLDTDGRRRNGESARPVKVLSQPHVTGPGNKCFGLQGWRPWLLTLLGCPGNKYFFICRSSPTTFWICSNTPWAIHCWETRKRTLQRERHERVPEDFNEYSETF